MTKASKLKIEVVTVTSLHEDPANAMHHDAASIDAIAASLTRFGQQKPIVVDGDGKVIAGNGTLRAAIKLGWRDITIHRTTLKGTEALAYALADNRTSQLAEWDFAALKTALAGLDDETRTSIRLDGEALEAIRAQLDDDKQQTDVVEDEIPEPPANPVTKAGDMWMLGSHRLLCGDSTSASDVARLMNGDKADICFTSPPYALGKCVSLRHTGKERVYDNHDDDAESWGALMDGWWQASLAAVDRAWLVNVQPLAGNKRDLMRWISDRADRLIDIVTWDKGVAQPAMASGVLSSRYEWIIGLGKVDATRVFPLSSWRGTIQNVYEAPPQRDKEFSDIHAATMPIHLPVWIMGSLCDESRSVYEPFCGTGTTLIAAEQLGRKCYGMEISPAYCDVIVQRWQKLTGKSATLEDGGLTFDRIERRRAGTKDNKRTKKD